jgi:hypothetical protein
MDRRHASLIAEHYPQIEIVLFRFPTCCFQSHERRNALANQRSALTSKLAYRVASACDALGARPILGCVRKPVRTLHCLAGAGGSEPPNSRIEMPYCFSTLVSRRPTASRHERPFHNHALQLRIMQLNDAPPRPTLDQYLKPFSKSGPGRPFVNRDPTRRQFA